MRPSTTVFSSLYILITSTSATTAITLDQFQPITGFSQTCVNAYNTPLSGCTASDFSAGSCSTTCIAFLEALTMIINQKCDGTGAAPDTLIASFFQSQGTAALCPNVLVGGGGGGGSGGEGSNYGTITLALQAGTSTSDSDMAKPTAASSTSSSTLPLMSAAPSQSTLKTSSSTASAEATTTQVAVIDTTVGPPTNLMTSFPSSTDQPLSGTSSPSSSSTGAPASGGGGSGGGSPLDVGSSSAACHNLRIKAWVLFLLAGSSGLPWLF